MLLDCAHHTPKNVGSIGLCAMSFGVPLDLGTVGDSTLCTSCWNDEAGPSARRGSEGFEDPVIIGVDGWALENAAGATYIWLCILVYWKHIPCATEPLAIRWVRGFLGVCGKTGGWSGWRTRHGVVKGRVMMRGEENSVRNQGKISVSSRSKGMDVIFRMGEKTLDCTSVAAWSVCWGGKYRREVGILGIIILGIVASNVRN